MLCSGYVFLFEKALDTYGLCLLVVVPVSLVVSCICCTVCSELASFPIQFYCQFNTNLAPTVYQLCYLDCYSSRIAILIFSIRYMEYDMVSYTGLKLTNSKHLYVCLDTWVYQCVAICLLEAT